jgi:hypothetical protein
MRISPVSVHEAAHACVAEELGVPVTFATIVPTGKTAGRVEYGEASSASGPHESPPLERLSNNMKKQGIIALAAAGGLMS